MDENIKDRLERFEDYIGYQFNNPNLLLQALTTPQYGNQNNIPHYEILENLGDSVIKLIFSLKLYNEGEDNPGNLTKIKQRLEDNQTFLKIKKPLSFHELRLLKIKRAIFFSQSFSSVYSLFSGFFQLGQKHNQISDSNHNSNGNHKEQELIQGEIHRTY